MCRTCGKRHNSYEFNPTSGTLQDVSLDSTGSVQFPIGLRAQGKFLPLRGRNMKEYEEQLNHLKNENFSLKLRVYFLEERLGEKGLSHEKEDLFKANMELKVEAEALKKDLHDKQELVRQASALLSSLEDQYKEQVTQIQNQNQKEKHDLKTKIQILEKELDDHCDKCRSISGDLNQLCGLAFDRNMVDFVEEDRIVLAPTVPLTSALRGLQTSPMQGIFSMPDEPIMGSLETEALTGSRPKEDTSVHDAKRIKELEIVVEDLQDKVTHLQGELDDKQAVSDALQQDVSNLKKEMEDQEEKLIDLETEVNEKDEKVDQLMQDLETRHLEIKAKDSTIQNLHDDLIKVEPEIEIKIQQIVERDRIIEEKLDQLQQQNKILVEIQITLDEKQKQISELEASLQQAQLELQQKSHDLQQVNEKAKGMLAKLLALERDNHTIKKGIAKKDKKIRDLTAQLKETLDMLQKASWEAETNGRGDDVRDMADDEHDGLWAELEQKKLDLKTLQNEKELALAAAQEQINLLRIRAESADALTNQLKLQVASIVHEKSGERDKQDDTKVQDELDALRKQCEAREEMFSEQRTLVATLRKDLEKTREDLQERKDDLKDLKKELANKNDTVQDFIANELSGRRAEVRDLQGKLFGSRGNTDNLEELRRVLRAANLTPHRKKFTTKPPIAQLRSNSLSEIEDPPVKEQTYNAMPSKSSGPGRSSSFSTLENALFAHMGQKVHNTNQTFNTYVMADVNNEEKTAETTVAPDTEARSSNANPYIDKDLGTSEEPDYQGGNKAIQILYEEMAKVRTEAQSLRQDREILSDKLDALQFLSNQSSRHGSADREQTPNSIHLLQKQIEDNVKQNILKDQEHGKEVSDFQLQIRDLKEEIKNEKKRITLQLLSMTTQKHQEALKNYKQEIASLRKRLADSHNACDLIRTKLEELMDFLEEFLNMDKAGLIDINRSKFKRCSILQAIMDSRDLSHSLSQSLMIGSDTNSEPFEKTSKFSLSIQEMQEADLIIPLLKSLPQEYPMNDVQAKAQANNEEVEGLTYEDIASTLDSANVFGYQSVQQIVAKLAEMSHIIHLKDLEVRSKVEMMNDLNRQIELLKKTVQHNHDSKQASGVSVDERKNSEQLKEIRPKTLLNSEESTGSFRTSVPDMSHLDSRLYEKGVLICPEDSQTSITSDPQLEYISFNSVYPRPAVLSSITSSVPQEKSKTGASLSVDPSVEKSTGILLLASPSESEAWSEPDRNVSLARIGLETCQPLITNTDRPISRGRVCKATPHSSESDLDIHIDEVKENGHCTVQAGAVTKYKRRTDATEVKRLTSKLKGIEQLNETLKAELHIYQTLSKHFNTFSLDKESERKPDVSDKSVDTNTEPLSSMSFDESSSIISASKPLLQEIQSLRMKLEEAIVNNDLLRDQLEAALAGYLSEEMKNLTSSLTSTQNELRILKEQLAISTNTEQHMRQQMESKEQQLIEKQEALSNSTAKNKELAKDIDQVQAVLKIVQSSLRAREDDVISLKNIQTLEEENLNMKTMKIREKDSALKSLNLDLQMLKCANEENQLEMNNRSTQIKTLEQLKLKLETRILDQNNYIADLCKTIAKHEEQNSTAPPEKVIANLQDALLRSETRLIQMTKEQFLLVGERSRLQAHLASVTTQVNLLKKEVDSRSESSDSCFSDSSHERVLERLKNSNAVMKHTENEKKILITENKALKKELELMQEELTALRSHLDHVRTKESLTMSRTGREFATLQASYKLLENKQLFLRESSMRMHKENVTLETKNRSLESQLGRHKSMSKEKSQLHSERIITRNLIAEITSFKNNINTDTTDFNNSCTDSMEHFTPLRLSSETQSTGKTSENKENIRVSRHFSGDSSSSIRKGRYSAASRDYYAPSCGSPDLGIGSDGQFSSLDRKGRFQGVSSRADDTSRDRKSVDMTKLCSDPSHSQLIHEKQTLLKEKDELTDRLNMTQETLNEALLELTTANQKKQSIEDAINRQLNKTNEVLRNTRHNRKSPSDSYRSRYSPNPS